MTDPNLHDDGAQTRVDGGPQTSVGDPTLRDGSSVEDTPSQVEPSFGRYVIEHEIGRGGMGVVYRAMDPKLDRPVALKVMLGSATETDIARMTREAQSVAQLSHPNVVSIFDVGTSGRRVFIVMEYLDGVTLLAWLRKRPKWRKLARVFIKAGRGLAAAHAAGLVHRDFKPANVLLGGKGAVKVLDFGLARHETDATEASEATDNDNFAVVSGLATLTATGIAMGTPPYMSPEQHRGERPSAATDIYAFGVSLYQGLYGELPFSAKTSDALIRQKMQGVAVEPVDAAIPKAVHAVVCRATAPNPEDRFASMNALLVALRRAIKRRQRRWGAVAAVAIGVVGAASLTDSLPNTVPTAAPAPATVATEPPATEAMALVAESKRLAELDRHGEALGVAFAAWPAAIASGSVEARGEAQLRIGLTLSKLQLKRLAEPHLRAAVDLLLEAQRGEAAFKGATILVDVLDYQERNAEAIEQLRVAEMVLTRFGLGSDPKHQAALVEARAGPAMKQDPAEGLRLFDEALEVQRNNPASFTDDDVARTLLSLAAFSKHTDPDRARELAEMGIELRLGTYDEQAYPILNARGVVADIDRVQGEYASCFAIASQNFLTAQRDMVQFRARSAHLASMCAVRLGHLESGLDWSDLALALSHADPSISDVDLAVLHAGRAGPLVQLERYALAEEQYQEALVLVESSDGHRPRLAHLLLGNLAEIIRGQGEHERARPYAERALKLARSEDLGEEAVHTAQANVGSLLLEVEKPDEALKYLGDWVEDASSESREGQRMLNRAKGLRAKAIWRSGGSRDEALRLAREAAEASAGHVDGTRLHRELTAWIREREGAHPPKH